jgi:hypothetical protein
MEIEKDGNLTEAGLWFVCTVVLAAKALKADGKLQMVFFILAVGFLAFGISDVVESHTGAWWRPFWLLIWKVVCVAVFYFGFREYYRLARAEKVAGKHRQLRGR